VEKRRKIHQGTAKIVVGNFLKYASRKEKGGTRQSGEKTAEKGQIAASGGASRQKIVGKEGEKFEKK